MSSASGEHIASINKPIGEASNNEPILLSGDGEDYP
jgi:hypothetical protein